MFESSDNLRQVISCKFKKAYSLLSQFAAMGHSSNGNNEASNFRF